MGIIDYSCMSSSLPLGCVVYSKGVFARIDTIVTLGTDMTKVLGKHMLLINIKFNVLSFLF